MFSLVSSGVNVSVVWVLQFWYSNFHVQLKFQSNFCGNIAICSGVHQGDILSLYLFSICIHSVLSKIIPSLFCDWVNVSYIAYAEDILLLSHSRSSLLNSMSSISNISKVSGLSLNIDRCEHLVFNAKSMPICLLYSNFPICCISESRWLGIHIGLNLLTFGANIVQDVKEKLQVGYGKIVANYGHYSRKVLALLHTSSCDHSILSLSGISPILNIKKSG